MTQTLLGLCLLWIGAAGFGALVVLRGRWQVAAGQGRAVPAPSLRKGMEAGLMFLGTGGMVLGLGLLGLGALR